MAGEAAGGSLAEEAQRALNAVTRNMNTGLAADIAQVEKNLRTALGFDRIAADIQHRVLPAHLFEQLAGPSTAALSTAAQNLLAGSLGAEYDRLGHLAEQITRNLMPTAPGLLVQQLKLFDGMTPPALQQLELTAIGNAVRFAFGDTPVETWRTSLLAGFDAARIADLHLPAIGPAMLAQLSERTRVATDLAERLATAVPGTTRTVGVAKSTRAWQQYIALKPTPHRVQMSTVAGTTVGGLIGGDLLLLPDNQDAEELADDVDVQVVEPWRSGPAQAREELFAALRRIDAAIVAFIEGAWDDVERSGAAAPSKIAHCVVEAVDHTLRALAPPEAVTTWLHRNGRQPTKTELDQSGRPTRPARVAFVLRARPGDRRLAQTQEQALASLVSRVQEQAQGVKHAPGAATVTQARMLLVTVESLLMQLTLE